MSDNPSGDIVYIATIREDGADISAYVPGSREPLTINNTHPYFTKVLEEIMTGNPDSSVFDYFDIGVVVQKKFQRLSEQVTVRDGRVFLDGDEVHNSLTNQILRFVEAGVDDWLPLVRFFEKVRSNPDEGSVVQLYDWLMAEEFSITSNGDIVGYKGVTKDKDGNYVSIHHGHAIVDDVPHTGQIPNPIGSTVEMPRADVAYDPGQACSVGLHVGNYDFANTYAKAALLEVHVNPRDVVSVPTDGGGHKIRVCRYRVVGLVEEKYNEPVVPDWHYEPIEEESYDRGDRDLNQVYQVFFGGF